MTTLAAHNSFDFADEGTVSEAPTHARGDLPRISQRDRQRAALTSQQLAPGHYLAMATDVVLEDRSVSRRHAGVTRTAEEVVLWDDRSLNGVQVNGARVAQAVLQPGDAIAMGDVQMRFVTVD